MCSKNNRLDREANLTGIVNMRKRRQEKEKSKGKELTKLTRAVW